MLVIKPKYTRKKKKPDTKLVEPSLKPEWKRIKTNQLINGKGVSVEPTLETEQKKISKTEANDISNFLQNASDLAKIYEEEETSHKTS